MGRNRTNQESRPAIRPVLKHESPLYPQQPNPRHDPARRRFLLQVAATGGAVAFASGVPLLKAQDLEIDFTVLESHDRLELTPSENARREAREDSVEAEVGREQTVLGESTPNEGSGGTGDQDPSGVPDDPPVDVPSGTLASITENRALWIPPGYLVLIQLTRDEDDETSIPAFEGASEQVSSYLDTTVTDTDQLHDVIQLREIELGILALLEPIVAPATIDVLHLDHDCTTVCGSLGPDDSHIMLRGEMPATYR